MTDENKRRLRPWAIITIEWTVPVEDINMPDVCDKLQEYGSCEIVKITTANAEEK